MDIAITVIHVIACFFLIIVVLLQTGKGADIGAAFGGSSQTVFGSGGAANLLTRLTTYTAIVFMLTSLFLTWNSTRSLTISVVDDLPIEPPPLAAPAPEPLAAPTVQDSAPAPEDASETASAKGDESDASANAAPEADRNDADQTAKGGEAIAPDPGQEDGGENSAAAGAGTNGD